MRVGDVAHGRVESLVRQQVRDVVWVRLGVPVRHLVLLRVRSPVSVRVRNRICRPARDRVRWLLEERNA